MFQIDLRVILIPRNTGLKDKKDSHGRSFEFYWVVLKFVIKLLCLIGEKMYCLNFENASIILLTLNFLKGNGLKI